MAENQAVADVGLIGLAVMGQNLVLNMADHGFKVAVFNRTTATMEKFVADNPGTPGGLVGCVTEADLARALKRPRKIVILVKAGAAVDAVVQGLLPLLEKGDIVIDGGNSAWTDTIRREKELAAGGIFFVGSGVSGGEEGARFGPSLMPGGPPEAWKQIKPIWEAIAAKVDAKTGKPLEGAAPGKPISGGVPCTAYIGPDGAGHYVKMVHNGIEYGDMQMICEAYYLLKNLLGLKPNQLSDVFADWNKGDLDSFLIEITTDILQQKDPADPRKKRYLVDAVLDTAGQKGTGKWTSTNALDMGVPAATVAEAVFARCLSAVKEERVAASKVLKGPKVKRVAVSKKIIEAVRDALYCSKICSYAQGFQLMATAQKEYNWKLNFGEIAMIWRGGCIIRARFLQKIKEAYDRNPELINLLLDPYFKKQVQAAQANWRRVVALAAEAGVSCPAFMSALSYYDGYRAAVLPANLLQAQRDYFGAHTFERIDQPRGKFFHVDWLDPNRPQSAVGGHRDLVMADLIIPSAGSPPDPLADEVIELRLLRILGPEDIATRRAEEQFLSRVPEYRFAIHRLKDGIRVGRIHLRITNDPGIIGTVGHTGYAVDEPHRRNGYAVRAIRLIIGLARSYGVAPLWVLIEPENVASRRAVERAGFQFVDIIDTQPEALALGIGPKVCRYSVDGR